MFDIVLRYQIESNSFSNRVGLSPFTVDNR